MRAAAPGRLLGAHRSVAAATGRGLPSLGAARSRLPTAAAA